eukprot:366346-Chlamydomonas_euryale.AAC.3
MAGCTVWNAPAPARRGPPPRRRAKGAVYNRPPPSYAKSIFQLPILTLAPSGGVSAAASRTGVPRGGLPVRIDSGVWAIGKTTNMRGMGPRAVRRLKMANLRAVA